MGLGDAFILEYSRTQRIIQKSDSPGIFFHTVMSYLCIICNRILIAGIRNLGSCPCPRCLIPLTRVHNMGMKLDAKQRVTMARVDNSQRRSVVGSARTLIYEQNLQVNSAAVERLLKDSSLVPTTVCALNIISELVLFSVTVLRTHSLRDFLGWGSICSPCYFQTKCMNLKVAYGEPFSFIFCGY
jgi:hypothetical protein